MHVFRHLKTLALLSLFASVSVSAKTPDRTITGSAGSQLVSESYAEFDQAWAMTFLPSGDLLVTEKGGTLQWLRLKDGAKIEVKGVPKVAYGGQGGLGDIILHPQYAQNNTVYLSYAQQGASRTRGAVVARATLRLPAENSQLETSQLEHPKLENIKVIWEQYPKTSGAGHYSHRMAFSPSGHLFITSGDRQKKKPAQDWKQNLGKVIRLNADGSVPADNPYQDKGELAKTFWSTGHRNLLGIDFDKQGQLWTHEMGPRHGDEFNLTLAGNNYGWPVVSWGDNYSGFPIPDHDTRPDFDTPEAYWVPSIAPSGLVIYDGALFPKWRGNAFIGGLRSQAVIRLTMTNNAAKEVERFAMGSRIREVEQGPQGAIWVLEDGSGGRLLRLTPVK